MSREIKFRAWNPNAKEFQGYAGSDIHMPLHEAGALAASPLVFEFMQYTGLCDRNGVEIYEGDIVRSYLADPKGIDYRVFWDESSAGFLLEHIETHDKGNNLSGLSDNPGSFIEKDLEVIGNIYENPGLLKEAA